MAVDTKGLTRHRGVVLRLGPWVLLAAADAPRPVIVIATDREGRLLLPQAASDGYALATLESIDATEQQVRATLADGPRLKLAPWQQHPRDKNAAFIFDVFVVPSSD